jgi:hypothetical protein
MPRNSVSFGDAFLLTLVTSDVELACKAEKAGVQRIGIDIERNGKAARQAGHDTRISNHTWTDLSNIRDVLRTSDLFIRLNPPHPGTAAEVELAIERGATVLMLPYFQSETDARAFAELVGRRAYTVLLAETPRSLVRIEEIAATEGIDEIMIGLNDIRLAMKLSGLEFLSSPLMSTLSRTARDKGKRFTFGGLGRHDDTTLPTDPDLIYAQYPRLLGSGAWLARSFFQNTPEQWTIEDGVSTLRSRLSYWARQPEHDLEHARLRLASQSSGGSL